MSATRLAAAAIIILGWSSAPVTSAEDDDLAALVAAYPDALVKYEKRALHWRDGTVTDIGEDVRKPFERTLRGASLFDQLRIPYPRGPIAAAPGVNEDPGRFRNLAFFRKMYGNCDRGEVQKHLVPVVWLPNSWNRTIRATSVNGVAQKLAAISNEIDRMPDKIKRTAYPVGGSFSCRDVVDTGQPSMHSYGAAIDLNISMSDYWYWHGKSGGVPTNRNRIPQEIVEIFERHGFIWGGKWYHFDTMHFEYRPELLELARRR